MRDYGLRIGERLVGPHDLREWDSFPPLFQARPLSDAVLVRYFRRLRLAELRVWVHVPGEGALTGAVRARTRATKRLPVVLGNLPVVPPDAERSLVGDYFPAHRSVEDIGHSLDDTNVQATMDDFRKIEMRVGRIVGVEDFPEARNPSYKLTIDFGPHGTRKSSAALRRWYDKADLEGRLVVCVTNFPPRRIATFESEVLTLGAMQEDGRVVLLEPDRDAELGSPIG